MASSFDDQNKKSNNNLRSGFLGKTGNDEVPIDKTYYNMLNVSPTATAAEIKRAYYTFSLQYHPDRTQNLDEFTRHEYAERFKHVSQAYSILSDPEKRTLYNRYGKDERIIGNNSNEMLFEEFEPKEFFRLMFGGEAFVDIIGDIELGDTLKFAISQMFKDEDQTPEQKEEQRRQRLIEDEQRKKFHEERIEKLSNNLISKLTLYTDPVQTVRDKSESRLILDQFLDKIRLEIPNLLEAPYGENLLRSIGYIYSARARFWLSKMDSQEGHIGKRIVGFGKNFQSTLQDRLYVVKETVKTVKCAVQLGQSMTKLAHATDNELNETDKPFQHHSGHLEYSGFTPTATPTATSTSTSTATPTATSTSTTEKKVLLKHKSSGQQTVPLTDEEKRQLEADTAAKSMEALWRVTKLEIESIERDVCDRVLHDSSCSRDIRRHRCVALSKIGELWQQSVVS